MADYLPLLLIAIIGAICGIGLFYSTSVWLLGIWLVVCAWCIAVALLILAGRLHALVYFDEE